MNLLDDLPVITELMVDAGGIAFSVAALCFSEVNESKILITSLPVTKDSCSRGGGVGALGNGLLFREAKSRFCVDL